MKRFTLVLAAALMSFSLNIMPLYAQAATPPAAVNQAQEQQAALMIPAPSPAQLPAHPQSNQTHQNDNPFGDVNTDNNKMPDDHFMSDFISMLASLGLLVALILIVSWFLKRFLNTRIQSMNTTSSIKIIERRALTPKTSIYLIEVNNRNIVIAEHTHGVTKLSEMGVDESEQEEEEPEKSSAFGEILKNKMSKETNPPEKR